MIDDTLLEAEEKMDKAVEVAKDDFATIRTGRANAAMFSKVFVDYYGSPTPLQQLASFNVAEARTILVSPFDKSSTTAIEKALRDSDLGVNPTNDGNVIRVVLPALTEERRRDFVKLAKHKAEEARVSVRNVRRRAKEELDRIAKDGEAGEDEVARAEKELEVLTRKHVDLIDTCSPARRASCSRSDDASSPPPVPRDPAATCRSRPRSASACSSSSSRRCSSARKPSSSWRAWRSAWVCGSSRRPSPAVGSTSLCCRSWSVPSARSSRPTRPVPRRCSSRSC